VAIRAVALFIRFSLNVIMRQEDELSNLADSDHFGHETAKGMDGNEIPDSATLGGPLRLSPEQSLIVRENDLFSLRCELRGRQQLLAIAVGDHRMTVFK
jgi:hypothetical protein